MKTFDDDRPRDDAMAHAVCDYCGRDLPCDVPPFCSPACEAAMSGLPGPDEIQQIAAQIRAAWGPDELSRRRTGPRLIEWLPPTISSRMQIEEEVAAS